MAKMRFPACLTLAFIALPLQAQASMQWSPVAEKHAHGGHSMSADKRFALNDGRGATLTLVKPDLGTSSLTAERGGVSIPPTGMDNYHALVAGRITGALHESAVRYFYLHGKPTGNSPSLLTAEQKSILEIEPAPLPREHWRYTAGEPAGFMVRFRGKPLAGATVSVKSSNGTSAEYASDADGYLDFKLPEDFGIVKAGRSGNRPAEFVLTASHADGAERFVTTLSSSYFVNPSHWQSLTMGMATALGGMLLGGLLTMGNLRRRGK